MADQREALALRAVGVGVVEVAAVAQQLAAACHCLTAAEVKYCGGREERLATTLAGKEAVAQVLGGTPDLQEIEIVRDVAGAPRVELRGAASDRARELAIGELALSLCHEAGVGAAVAAARG
jgi:holo-[acyl-carrier protein] synthase